MRVLITGAAGFVGRYLARELTAHDHVVYGLDRAGAPTAKTEWSRYFEVDIRATDQVNAAVREAAPDAFVHLAALASVPACRNHPQEAFAVNTTGTLALLETMRREAPAARVLLVSSAHVYAAGPPDIPIPETAQTAPATFYGLTKLAAEELAQFYAREYGFRVTIVRPVNHIGPGQTTTFVIPAFAEKIAAVARKESEPVVRVGNLESTRDFLDVRDTVRAYRKLLEHTNPRRIYNVAGGRKIPIGTALEQLCQLANIQPRIEQDPELFRPTDHSPLLDTSRIQADIDWTPTVTVKQILEDVYRQISKT